MLEDTFFAQESHRVRLEWGRDGAKRAAERGDVLVIVDVLRFSTAVAMAVSYGVAVAPYTWDDDPYAFADSVGAEVATGRPDAPRPSRFSLSPHSFAGVAPGTRTVLPSPNGATCSRHGAQVPYLFAGALVNAQAVARAAHHILATGSHALTVVACGERWRQFEEDGELRFALEDYLGAGAILSHIESQLSPEAEVCARAFQSVRGDLVSILLGCGSGCELVARNQADDIVLAAHCDSLPVAPVLRDGWFVPWQDEFLT
jgi:2-phosphosulfolactate phosphatase